MSATNESIAVTASTLVELHALYEQLLLTVALYSGTVQVDVQHIHNEYVVALLDSLLHAEDAEITESILPEYENLQRYAGLLADNDGGAGAGQAVVDAIMAQVLQVQAALE